MKKLARTFFIVAALATGGITALAHAAADRDAPCRAGMGYWHHAGHEDFDRHIDRMTETLGLSTQQRDAMRVAVDKARPQMRTLHDKLRDSRKQLHALMRQDTFVEADVRKLADAKAHAMADMIVLRTKLFADIRQILTPEQREQLKQWHESR